MIARLVRPAVRFRVLRKTATKETDYETLDQIYPFGLPVERDRHFTPRDTLMVYARAAWNSACVTENPQALCEAAAKLGRAS